MKKLELVFVPLPDVGHLVSTVEFAKAFVGANDGFSITMLILEELIRNPYIPRYVDSVSASFSGPIQFVHLPKPDLDPPTNLDPSSAASFTLFKHQMDLHKQMARNAILESIQSGTAQLAGIVVDMWFNMADVADELGVPYYAFYTSSAASLAHMFHLHTLHDHQGVDLTHFSHSDPDYLVPGFINPFTTRFPPAWWEEKLRWGCMALVLCARTLRKAKGIVINTFMGLESHFINALADDSTIPPVYAVGPLLNSNQVEQQKDLSVFEWLDDQPSSSVVFISFGSLRGFDEEQTHNIAYALEKSGYRFLWILRRPAPSIRKAYSSEYQDLNEVLPSGFLDRTSKIGKIVNWAPQMDVLGHPAIGGFISHCGWNSILESLCNGVPTATWPIHPEQQVNAFLLVKELKIGVEIKLGYREDSKALITTLEIERGIRSLMSDSNNTVERRVKIREEASKALLEGGSSSSNIQRLSIDMMANISSNKCQVIALRVTKNIYLFHVFLKNTHVGILNDFCFLYLKGFDHYVIATE